MTNKESCQGRLKLLSNIVNNLKGTSEYLNRGTGEIYEVVKRLENSGFELKWIAKSIEEGKKRRVRKCSKKRCGNEFFYEPQLMTGGMREMGKIQKFCPDCVEKLYIPRLEGPSDNNFPPLSYHAQLYYGFALLRSSDDSWCNY